MAKVRVGVVGGSGYIGLELLRLLLVHPHCEVVFVTSRELGGKPLGEVHPALEGITKLKFSEFDPSREEIDLLFVSAPHTQGMALVQAALKAKPGLRVIDLSADFRLSKDLFVKHYGTDHIAPELLARAVFGAPELWPERVQSAQLVANPGCFAHCCILALAPLAQAGCITGPLRISAVTGSSGSGISLSRKTHHPERNESLAAYNVLGHRHVPEIEQTLGGVAGGATVPRVELVPVSGPFSRGIFATCFATIKDRSLDVGQIYSNFCSSRTFLRQRSESPRLIDVRGSNFVDIAVHQQGAEVVIIAALDNLMKGGSGNAVQCMNLMFELGERSGLQSPPLYP